MEHKHTPGPWQESACRAPMWLGGAPAGLCGAKAHGHQFPSDYLLHTRGHKDFPYCFRHACPNHGGPQVNEVRIFQDGLTDEGRQMWCAVMPDFVNLQESPAGFHGNPVRAVANLKAAIAKGSGATHE
ncbi:hypothetical protein GCM10010096_34670 [Alcaligenes pakistanensis]|uniref:Uncharacterized protein n=1 Tax=Alcaligenes pakistanensis TaxID=1482717 RepID=A0A8H9MA69_9BURK|nr:hypothetical protein GCM10010096_34670 [Alcaligenes pakistanensis]